MTKHEPIMNASIFTQKNEFFEQSFSSLSYPCITVADKIFEGCKFINVNIPESQFIRCKFVECEFNNCNLSVGQL